MRSKFRIPRAGRVLLALVFIQSAAPAGEARNWSRFRGADGSGHVDGQSIPVTWTPADVAWRTELEGLGHSSPCLRGGQIFLTSARRKDDDRVERLVMALDRDTGKELWQRVASTGEAEDNHPMNSFATSTCASDGERVVAFFGRGGIHCYDLQGEKIWSRDLGKFPGPWGTAASPVIVGDLVIQNCDAQGESALLALDKSTGEERWRTSRGTLPRGGWSTPIVIDAGSRKELILNGEFGVHGYDPDTGRELWFCKGFNGRGTPMPVFDGSRLYVISAKPGDTFAVRPGGSGEVRDSHLDWHTPRTRGRILASPILEKNVLLTVSMEGFAFCYDRSSGRELWKDRLDGRFTAAPIATQGRFLLLNEAGNTVVIKPGPALEVVSTNKLGAGEDETFRASLVPGDGCLFARSDRALYCIGNQPDRNH